MQVVGQLNRFLEPVRNRGFGFDLSLSLCDHSCTRAPDWNHKAHHELDSVLHKRPMQVVRCFHLNRHLCHKVLDEIRANIRLLEVILFWCLVVVPMESVSLLEHESREKP